jgi:glycosyltransferase involved in cell wall biosynthesis
MKKRLIIFNLEMNLDSTVMAAAHDWVESFAKNYDVVKVYSTHVGRVMLPANVTVTEIGGGTVWARLRAFSRLLRVVITNFGSRREMVVFHHMSTYTAVILGPVFRLLGIKQGLWYSHSVKSLSLTFAACFVDFIFSSSPEALPLDSSKSSFIGHGISLTRFKNHVQENNNRSGIVSLGRYAPIKRFESLLELARYFKSIKFDLYGPTGSVEYRKFLVDEFESKYPNVSIGNALDYAVIPNLLSKYEYFYSGTPKSVDKAAIEAALSGCFILSINPPTIEISGMSEVWNLLGIPCPREISRQIVALEAAVNDRNQLRSALVLNAQRRNNLEFLTSQISISLNQ